MVWKKISTHTKSLAHEQAIRSMMESISEQMHNILITSLKENKYPMSIILDTSTDAANNNFLLIYIHTIENNYAMTYLYRCLLIKSEASESLFTVIKNALNEDKL